MIEEENFRHISQPEMIQIQGFKERKKERNKERTED